MIKSLRWAAAAVALCVANAAHAVEFSADSVAHNSVGQTHVSKIYVSNGMVRVEPAGLTSYEILDTAKPAGYFIVPGKKLCVVQPLIMAAHNASAFNVGVTPCIKLMGTGGFATCKKLGADKVNGRPTEKWQLIQTGPGGTNGMGQSFTSTVWIDRGLGAIVKAESVRGTLEYRNLHMGPQPASLFAIPAGYVKQPMPAPGTAG